jgi:hypothetical protein
MGIIYIIVFFHLCISLDGSLDISPYVHVYIFGSITLISIQMLFITLDSCQEKL